MSTFRLWKNILIDIGTTPSGLQTEIKTRMVEAGWRVVQEADVSDANRYVDYLPPLSQTIGNTDGYEVLRIEVTSTAVRFNPYVVSNTSRLKRYTLRGATGSGAGVNVGGTAVTVGTTNATGDAGTLALFNLLTASGDANVNKWTYQLVNLTATTSDDYIIATAKLPATADNINAIGAANTTLQANNYVAGAISPDAIGNATQSATIDLVNGFIYFLSVTDRSVGFATKTNSAFFGPIVAAYADNAAAVSQTPAGCVPIELVTLDLNAVALGAGAGAGAKFTHFWGYVGGNGPTDQIRPIYNQNRNVSSPQPEDVYAAGSYSPTISYNYGGMNTGFSSVQFNQATGGGTNILGVSFYVGPSASTLGVAFGPSYGLEDVTVFYGTANDEQLIFARDFTNTSTLTAAMLAGDNTLALASAAAFPASGTIIVDSETIEYTGKAGNTLTGLTRGRYGTTAAGHASGATVYMANWYAKIKGGAMLAGYVKPTN